MKFDFAKYYDVTDYAKSLSDDYNQYEKIFVCVDTWDFWICRIQKGWRNDVVEGYVEDENNILIERNKIAKRSKGSGIDDKFDLTRVLREDLDDLGNWDTLDCDSMEEVMDVLDDGHGLGVYVEK